MIVASLGAITAIVTGVVSHFKFREHWYEYRKTAEDLKHEKYMYQTRKGHYATGNEFAILVEHVEALVSTENTSWHRRLKLNNEND